MLYRHNYFTKAALDDVRDFHAKSASMVAITPPPILVQIHKAPEYLQDGDEMDFTLWILLLPIHWIARIEDVTPNGFVDRQLLGPFKNWIHKHTFIQRPEGVVEVVDEVNFVFSSQPFWWLVGVSMWLSLPLLFAYRGWRTRMKLGK